MFTITVRMDDHKLLHESNLTARQPRRATITHTSYLTNAAA